jgi:secondary thiamine-phosphate synthase enzyme
MRQSATHIEVRTEGPGLYEATLPIRGFAESQGMRTGLLTVFLRHTSASLVIQENADADVQADLVDAFARLAPERAPYRHRTEGPDDMPAHIKASLTPSSLSIPLIEGRLVLGTWQGIYVFEHRAPPQRRKLALHLIGD